MVARIAHNFGGRIETHRLGIEQGAAESGGVVLLDPGRHVNEMGEAGSVAFGKTVRAEALDLAEAALGIIAIITACRHATDQLFLELVDRADIAEGGHGTPETVGLFGREMSRHNSELHRLFLKQRHAHGLSKHLMQFVGRTMLR